jgi:hypothetical protein
MTTITRSVAGRRASLAIQLLVALTLVAAFLTTAAGSADAQPGQRCQRHPVKCQRVHAWANLKEHQFRSRNMPRTDDRYLWGLWKYYRAAWYKKYGRALAGGEPAAPLVQQFGEPTERVTGVQTPYGLCSGWGDCFSEFVEAANCAAHPIVTAVCLTSSVLDDGIGQPEKAELICGGTVLITSGGNPVAVGRGFAGCYWVWLAWQIFG